MGYEVMRTSETVYNVPFQLQGMGKRVSKSYVQASISGISPLLEKLSLASRGRSTRMTW